jgi:hypothetical protein
MTGGARAGKDIFRTAGGFLAGYSHYNAAGSNNK